MAFLLRASHLADVLASALNATALGLEATVPRDLTLISISLLRKLSFARGCLRATRRKEGRRRDPPPRHLLALALPLPSRPPAPSTSPPPSAVRARDGGQVLMIAFPVLVLRSWPGEDRVSTRWPTDLSIDLIGDRSFSPKGDFRKCWSTFPNSKNAKKSNARWWCRASERARSPTTAFVEGAQGAAV